MVISTDCWASLPHLHNTNNANVLPREVIGVYPTVQNAYGICYCSRVSGLPLVGLVGNKVAGSFAKSIHGNDEPSVFLWHFVRARLWEFTSLWCADKHVSFCTYQTRFRNSGTLGSDAARLQRLRRTSPFTRVKLAKVALLDNSECPSCGVHEDLEHPTHLLIYWRDDAADSSILFWAFQKARRPHLIFPKNGRRICRSWFEELLVHFHDSFIF